MSDLPAKLELSTERMENKMNKVFLVNDYDGYALSAHANRESAELRVSELVSANKQHWFDTFGDLDGNFDIYDIVEMEVN
jgi:hypothetical protein